MIETMRAGVTARYASAAVRVLLVEDDPNSRWALAALLKHMGYECRTAGDGQEALPIASSFSPHVILMDLMMPVMDGLEATRMLKADPATRDIPVLALTADDTPCGRARAEQAGCDDFLAKPVVLEDLVRRICEHLARRAASNGGA